MNNRSTKFDQLRNLLLLCLGLGISTFSFGQEYYHGLGGQYSLGTFYTEYTNIAGNTLSDESTPIVPGVFYKATLALSDNFAVSGYPFLGFAGSFNSRGGSAVNLGVAVPVLAEFYLGELDDNAFYVGADLCYAALGSSFLGSGNLFGSQVGIGGQFYLFGGRIWGLRASYTHGINKAASSPDMSINVDRRRLYTIGVYYPLGVN